MVELLNMWQALSTKQVYPKKGKSQQQKQLSTQVCHLKPVLVEPETRMQVQSFLEVSFQRIQTVTTQKVITEIKCDTAVGY